MRIALIGLCALAGACGGGTATVTPQPAPQQTGIYDASGNQWQWYESSSWGIRLAVPNPQNCVQSMNGGNGRLLCDYGDIHIEVHSIPRRMMIAELRDYAISVTNIPANYWTWEGERTNHNNYSFAEAWSATNGPQAIVGVAGHSGVRAVSHVCFIYGDAAALARNQGALERFVFNVWAI
jgi:hypothetical protein